MNLKLILAAIGFILAQMILTGLYYYSTYQGAMADRSDLKKIYKTD